MKASWSWLISLALKNPDILKKTNGHSEVGADLVEIERNISLAHLLQKDHFSEEICLPLEQNGRFYGGQKGPKLTQLVHVLSILLITTT